MFSDEALPDLSAAQLEQIVERFPHSRALLDVDTTVKGYYEGLAVDERTFRLDRAQALLRVLRWHIDDLFPAGTSSDVTDQLVRSPVLSTAEHMGSNTNPQTLNVVINQAIYRRRRNQKHVLALACTAIKLDNILFSRDLFVGDHKLHLLSAKYKRTLVTEAPVIDCAYVEESLRMVLAKGHPHMRQQAAELLCWWQRAYQEINHLDMFWKQLAVLNYFYWKEVVNTNHLDLPASYVCLPGCILVRDAMLADLRAGREGWFYDMLFNPVAADAAYRVFDGIRSCWDSAAQSGTFLFWTMNGRGEPKRMSYRSGALESDGVASHLALRRDAVLAALSSGAVYPSSFLLLAYLGFYLGLQLFGGILQAQYYPEMRRRILLGNPLGLPAEDIENIKSLRPDLYLNFEKRELSDGGLLKLCCPQPAEVYQQYAERPFRREIMGCMGYLYDLAK